tara:strand:- start:192 stop:1103 length:912 start_codon:yes stop_codon:yes gene_type:complete
MLIGNEYQSFFEKYKTDVLGLHELSLHNFWNSEDTLSFKKECTNLVNYLSEKNVVSTRTTPDNFVRKYIESLRLDKKDYSHLYVGEGKVQYDREFIIEGNNYLHDLAKTTSPHNMHYDLSLVLLPTMVDFPTLMRWMLSDILNHVYPKQDNNSIIDGENHVITWHVNYIPKGCIMPVHTDYAPKRKNTIIVFLNTNWEDDDGGHLKYIIPSLINTSTYIYSNGEEIVYLPYRGYEPVVEVDELEPRGKGAYYHETEDISILPKWGNVVVMDHEVGCGVHNWLPHLVTKCNKDRISLYITVEEV